MNCIFIQEQGDKDEDSRFLLQQPDLNPSPHSSSFITDRRFREICIILEGMNETGILGKGWRALAESIGIVKHTTISTIECRARYQHKSPGTIVLDYFFSQRKNTDDKACVLDALTYLSNIFENMDNAHAKLLVEEEIQEIMSNEKEDETVTAHSGSMLCVGACVISDQQAAAQSPVENCQLIHMARGVPANITSGGFTRSASFTNHSSADKEDLEEDGGNGIGCCAVFLFKRSPKTRTELPHHSTIREAKEKVEGSTGELATVGGISRDSGYGTVEPRPKYSSKLSPIESQIDT